MSQVDADRSVLFVTLAAQSDLINAQQFAEALSTWASNRSKPIGQVLNEHGMLDTVGSSAVEALVQTHLSRHGGDAARSLGSLSTAAEHRIPGLETIQDTEIQSSLARLPGPPDAADPYATSAETEEDQAPAQPTRSSGPRFRVLRPHARGGLGEVHVAQDEELDREVALKEIQQRFADDPGSRSRFLIEAKITGNLEHPGIVPVYGLGRYGDGRPYYAMRFVRGETLRDAIERFHRGESRPKSPGDRAVRLRKLLVRFLAVCDAVEYAHSRGVVHRDLKPANILLGPYGETLVVDWGLAKSMTAAASDEPDEPATTRTKSRPPTSRTNRSLDQTVAGSEPPTPLLAMDSGSTDHTKPGATVGTPQYMPPEQARGVVDRLSPMGDVYSLGATLYSMLTGRPPVDGEDVETVLERVRTGELVPARMRNRSISPRMESICSRAMAFSPEDRYPTARALADDLERWLADEPVLAHREAWPARMGRWARHHRSAVVSVAMLLIAATLAMGAGTLLVLDRNQAVEAQRGRALAEASRANEEEARAKSALARAEAEAERASRAELDARSEAEVARNTADFLADLLYCV